MNFGRPAKNHSGLGQVCDALFKNCRTWEPKGEFRLNTTQIPLQIPERAPRHQPSTLNLICALGKIISGFVKLCPSEVVGTSQMNFGMPAKIIPASVRCANCRTWEPKGEFRLDTTQIPERAPQASTLNPKPDKCGCLYMIFGTLEKSLVVLIKLCPSEVVETARMNFGRPAKIIRASVRCATPFLRIAEPGSPKSMRSFAGNVQNRGKQHCRPVLTV